MLAHLIIGAILISVTVVIHAIALDRLMYTLEKLSNKMFLWFRMLWKAAMLTVAVLESFAPISFRYGCGRFFTLLWDVYPISKQPCIFRHQHLQP